MSIETTIKFEMTQLAYGSTADISLTNLQLSTTYGVSQLAYGSTADIKVSSIPYPGDVPEAKLVYNVLYFVFSGRAFLFDGEEVVEAGSPVVAIYPIATSKEDRAYVTGGLTEEGSVVPDLYVRGVESYVMTADRDYIAVLLPTDMVYVIDEKGSIVTTHKITTVLPLFKGWKLVSRAPFIAVIQRLL